MCPGGVQGNCVSRGYAQGLCPGGVCVQGVCVQEGECPGGVSQQAMEQTSPMNRMADRCKNIAFVCWR